MLSDTLNKFIEINGLEYVPAFINKIEQEKLLNKIDNQPWLSDLKRRVQHYGYKYDYKARKIEKSMDLGALPAWLFELAHRLKQENFITEIPDQVIINEYIPGQGISHHIDCVPCFTNTIISLSLGSACVMDFKNLLSNAKVSILLEPRSLIILKDEARYQWSHSIAARKNDNVEGEVIPRQRRVSLTFRKVILT